MYVTLDFCHAQQQHHHHFVTKHHQVCFCKFSPSSFISLYPRPLASPPHPEHQSRSGSHDHPRHHRGSHSSLTITHHHCVAWGPASQPGLTSQWQSVTMSRPLVRPGHQPHDVWWPGVCAPLASDPDHQRLLAWSPTVSWLHSLHWLPSQSEACVLTLTNRRSVGLYGDGIVATTRDSNCQFDLMTKWSLPRHTSDGIGYFISQ